MAAAKSAVAEEIGGVFVVELYDAEPPHRLYCQVLGGDADEAVARAATIRLAMGGALIGYDTIPARPKTSKRRR